MPTAEQRLDREATVHLRNVLLSELAVCVPPAQRQGFAMQVASSVDSLIALLALDRARDARTQGLVPERAMTVDEFARLFCRINLLRGKPVDQICATLKAHYDKRMLEFPPEVPLLPSARDTLGEYLRSKVPNGKARQRVVESWIASWENDPHGRHVGQIAAVHEERVRAMQTVNLTDNTIYGLMFASGYPVATGTKTPLNVAAFDDASALRALQSLQSGDWLDEHALACLFASIRTRPAISAAAADCAYALLRKYTTNSEIDHTVGVWQAATAIVLNLPPQVLKRMVFAPRVVELLRHEARMLLGNAHFRAMPKKDRPKVNFRQYARGQGLLDELAQAALTTPDGHRLAQSLAASLQILEHNAQRLMTLLEQEHELPSQDEGRLLIDVLDAHVKVPFPGQVTLRFVEEPLLALTVEGEFPELDDAPHAGNDSPALPAAGADTQPRLQPAAQSAAGRAAHVTVHLPPGDDTAGSESKRPAAAPVRPNKQAGSRADQPGMHWHRREHRQLDKHQVKDRKLRHKLVNAGLLNPYATWTPEVRAALLDEMRNERVRRNHLTETVVGNRLVARDLLRAR
ncbi:hypothetical protein GHT07_00355 [Caenimonas koreensis DSM 17982]|uniref:Uncharacterized protein n=1 Tax=Caenimonas koreensis DSM 17982 TaxID=1121255 RepID=A0A844AY68_9BURK|nr:hypothetical protein [Caenimonas koreensis]MRD45713.1 hypothetical protein [Caenimonas koreensis DSM 17982]